MVFLAGAVSAREASTFARELHNPLIERASIYPASRRTHPIVVPRVAMHEAVRADKVDLEVSDEELVAIGKSGIKNAEGHVAERSHFHFRIWK